MIYRSVSTTLQNIFQDATARGVLMIPDIQREYVWSPDRVIRLIDSALKGWPFGVLLLWETGLNLQHVNLIPCHPFRKKISRGLPAVAGFQTESFGQPNLPNHITMVLDGQQRLQSLLLAFAAHDTGLGLLDKHWYASSSENENHPYRGALVNTRCQFAQVYINLKKLSENVSQIDGVWELNSDIDWTQIFEWVLPSETHTHLHPIDRPGEYQWPICRLGELNVDPGCYFYVKASAFWEAAAGFHQMPAAQKQERVYLLLENNQASELQDDPTVVAAAKLLLNILSNLRVQEIQCLTLQNQQDAGFAGRFPEYAETVVNIFNRLNAAGVSLQRSEMASAWVRMKWNLLEDNGVPASLIYDLLIEDFGYKKLDESQVVRALCIIWLSATAIDVNGIRLFSNADVLSGVRIQEMTEWLHENWQSVRLAFRYLSNGLQLSGVRFGRHYKSMNLIYLSLAYFYNSLHDVDGLARLEVDGFVDGLMSELFRYWFATIFSGWWGKNSDTDTIRSIGKMIELRENEGVSLVGHDLIVSACGFVHDFDADDAYSACAPLLYLWTWIDQGRRNWYRDNNVGELLSIDHIYPRVLWNAFQQINPEFSNISVHSLGNLFEIGRVDNSSKNASTLFEWLSHEDEIRNAVRQQVLFKIQNLFKISNIHCSRVDEGSVDELFGAVQNRTNQIKNDLIAYFQEE